MGLRAGQKMPKWPNQHHNFCPLLWPSGSDVSPLALKVYACCNPTDKVARRNVIICLWLHTSSVVALHAVWWAWQTLVCRCKLWKIECCRVILKDTLGHISQRYFGCSGHWRFWKIFVDIYLENMVKPVTWSSHSHRTHALMAPACRPGKALQEWFIGAGTLYAYCLFQLLSCHQH